MSTAHARCRVWIWWALIAFSLPGLSRAALAGPPEATDPVYFEWSCESLQGMGYLILQGDEWSWIEGRGAGVSGASGRFPLGRLPRANERLWIQAPADQPAARILEQPGRHNGYRTLLEVPRPELSWNQGDRWDCDDRAPTPYQLQLVLLPRKEWVKRQLLSGEHEGAQRKGFQLEGQGKWEEALEHWQVLCLAIEAGDPGAASLQRLARERHRACHRRIQWTLEAADLAKVEALHQESVRAHYGGDGQVLPGKRVMLLWPATFADHPSVPDFLADLDLAYGALIDLTGQDPYEVYGHRLCYFFMERGAAWFNHHIGMGSAEFQQYPPMDSVYLHEMGHDFFKYPTDLIAPESSWGEGMASFAQLRALEVLDFHRAGLTAIYQEGVDQLTRHGAQGGERSALGAYFMGASFFSGLSVEVVDREARWNWSKFRRVLGRFRDQQRAPLCLRDRYRHWGDLLIEEFGTGAREQLERFDLPTDSPGDASVQRERDEILPRLHQAQMDSRRGQEKRALSVLRKLARRKDHRLRGEVQLALVHAERQAGNERRAEAAADALGFLRSWQIHRPLQTTTTNASRHVFPPEAQLGPGLLPTSFWDRAGGTASRVLGAEGIPWMPAHASDWVEHRSASPLGAVDLLAVLGSDGSRVETTYALTRVHSDRAQGVDLRVGHDDDLVVFLNGQRVARREMATTVHVDHGWIPLELRAGENLLMLKVTNRAGGWGFQARLTGDDGLAAPGISSTLPTPTPGIERSPTVPLWSLGEPDGDFRDLALIPREDDWGPHYPQGVHVRAEDPQASGRWSHIHPGPRDRWAGEQIHRFRLDFDTDRPDLPHELVIWTVGQNGWTPPTLRVELAGEQVEFDLPGSPDSTLSHPEHGTPCRLEIEIPPRLLKRMDNQLELSIPKGSWILYDALQMRRTRE